jgi:FkbM family methyltransferase
MGEALWPRRMGPIRNFEFKSDFFNVRCQEVEVEGRRIRYVDTAPMSQARLTSLFDKEPTTIPWLESFGRDETLVDIGANIGMYTTYAAAFTGCQVFAFEPEALNFAELNKNVFVNGLHGRVLAYCMALSDETKVDRLNLGAFGIAYSHHDFAENTWAADMQWGGDKSTRRDARLPQGCAATTLDALVESGVVPVPDHIKIDVDGLEHRVMAGCRRTLENPKVKSLLVEIDFRSEHAGNTIDTMVAQGWKYSWDQLCTNRNKILTREYVEELRRARRAGLNYIFFRDDKYARLFASFLAGYRPPWPGKAKA